MQRTSVNCDLIACLNSWQKQNPSTSNLYPEYMKNELF